MTSNIIISRRQLKILNFYNTTRDRQLEKLRFGYGSGRVYSTRTRSKPTGLLGYEFFKINIFFNIIRIAIKIDSLSVSTSGRKTTQTLFILKKFIPSSSGGSGRVLVGYTIHDPYPKPEFFGSPISEYDDISQNFYHCILSWTPNFNHFKIVTMYL